MILKEIKYYLHYGEVRGRRSRSPHGSQNSVLTLRTANIEFKVSRFYFKNTYIILLFSSQICTFAIKFKTNSWGIAFPTKLHVHPHIGAQGTL